MQLRHGHVLPSDHLPVQQVLLWRLRPGCLSSAYARPQASHFLEKHIFSPALVPHSRSCFHRQVYWPKTSNAASTQRHTAAQQGLSQRKYGSARQRKFPEIAATHPKALTAARQKKWCFQSPTESRFWALSLQGSVCFHLWWCSPLPALRPLGTWCNVLPTGTHNNTTGQNVT